MKTFLTLLLAIIVLPLITACASGLSKRQLDDEVRRLCEIDGGIKVYETVTLPANKFDEYGNVKIKSKKLAKPTDEYYLEFKEVYLKKGSPRLIRFNTQVIRAIDGKVMGESIRYARSGGDFPGPWHETSFGCPPLPMNLSASIFFEREIEMDSITDYFEQAEFALAAYSNLNSDMSFDDYVLALRDDGKSFSFSQATTFADTYRVVDQYNDPNSGLSATIFRHADDVSNTNSFLAIRGTELSDINDLFAGLSIALIGDTTKLQPQYTSLKAKVTEWLTNGTISPTFTVTGHSLGGFLATGLTTDFAGNVSHAYLYNTPGVGGVFGSMTNAILDFLGIAQTYDPGKFSNIEAATGISPIAGLGYDVSPPIDIIIENQLNPDVTNAPASKNHSQQVLTDTLAVYSLYSQLLPSFDQNQLNSLINAFGSIKDTQGTSNSTTLESALDALRTIVLNPGEGQIILDDTHKTARGDRDAFYTNFESLNGNQALITLSGTAQLTLLSELNANQIITMAVDNGAQGMAARFALSALNPFVLEGIDYSAFNNNNVLDLFNPASGAGMISDQYLEDRVTMLVRKLWFNINDQNPYNPSAQVDSHNFNIHQYLKSDIYFEDASTGYKIQQGGLFPNTPRYFFGSDAAETPTGSASKDRLYGGGGNDTLQGLEGNDYLEGGKGADTYIVNQGDGIDTILDVDGLGSIQFCSVPVQDKSGYQY